MELSKIGEVIFYVFSIGLPSLFVLYTLGYLVFIIGEYTENRENIPNGILLTATKLFIIFFMLFMEIYILFELTHPNINILSIVMFMFGNLICVESISIVRTLNMVNVVLNSNTNNIKLQTHKLFLKNKSLIIFKGLFSTLLMILSIISLFTQNMPYVVMIILLLIVYISFNYYIIKHVIKTVQ